ncbi:TetR/AcrR family transcriptional regulator [Aerococcaceae bacterium DSM 111021]|nr:TetR/AcrR family transcriptional regulator [Aerococcaceae bacterium DSM 111021]
MTSKEISTRQMIIDTARKKFMTDGYKATSTRHIAKEVGITQPNLYYHFQNKETLYISVLEQVGNEVNNQLSYIAHNSDLSLQESLNLMTNYLQNNDPIDIYTMMKDMDSDLSAESKSKLYTIFLKGYQQPFIDLFEENITKLRSDLVAEQIASHYFLVIAPYISPDMQTHKFVSTENIIDLFLNGIKI